VVPLPTPLTFSGVALDRANDQRKDADWIARQLRAPEARAVAATSEAVLIDRPRRALRRLPVPSPLEPGEAVLLGLQDGGAVFGLDLESQDPAKAAQLAGAGELIGLRQAGAELPPAEAALAANLAALMHWHRRNRFCANCGAPTAIEEAGYSRRCPSCGATHFPRTDPVVIMIVEHDGRLLMGRRQGWPADRYSLLAGFVSPGESLEEAVVREVREESGIEARNPRFVASQPWPFPCSLMLGFHAGSRGGDPVALDGELEEVRWFSAETVRAALGVEVPDWADGPPAGRELVLPPGISIARFLVEHWLSGR
jgi:NAD+ diphosphatase